MSLQALAEQPFELLVELERRARAAIAAREGTPTASDEWVGIGFRLGAERFVTSRADVREVLPIPDQVTRVPGAKPWLRGIANLRGQLLTVVDLSAIEFKLLSTFVKGRGRLFTRDQLLDAVRGPGVSLNDRVVDNHIVSLRRKIEAVPTDPKHLKNIRGLGYRFDA